MIWARFVFIATLLTFISTTFVQALTFPESTSNTSKGTTLTAQKLLDHDPNQQDADLIPVQLKLEAYDTVKSDIRAWSTHEATYRAYIEQHLAKPGVMLNYFNDLESDRPMNGSIDVLAKILGQSVKIYG